MPTGVFGHEGVATNESKVGNNGEYILLSRMQFHSIQETWRGGSCSFCTSSAGVHERNSNK